MTAAERIAGLRRHLERHPDCTWLHLERTELDALLARLVELEGERDEARAAAQRFVDRKIDWADGWDTAEFARSLPWLNVYRGEMEEEIPSS